MLSRLLLGVAVLAAGFQIAPGGIAASSSVRDDIRLIQTASNQVDRGGMLGLQRWARGHSGVRSVGRGPDGHTITLDLADGVRASLLAGPISRVRLSPSGLRPRMRMAAPGQPRAVVMEPFATELGLGSNAGDLEKSALQGAGYSVDQLYDQQVTLASMAALHTYNVVYLETHSGVNTGGEGVVATGQLAGDNDPGVAPLLKSGAAILVHVSGSQQIYYGITSTFITYYENNWPGNSIVFLNGCETLTAPLFWQALHARGVGVMVSWDKEATSMDNYLSGGAFFAEMATGLSVAAAIAAEKSAGYGTSNVNNTTANLGYLGNGALTLRDAANPPAPTATPPSAVSATPTAPAGTVVPQPTRPASKPPLSVTLRHEVAAGARQVVRITSSPNTTVRVHIVFPTGDTRTATIRTDAAGAARYAYPQHRGRVTDRSVVATVTVEAMRGGAVTTVTQRYHIGLGTLDVVVLPHVQSVGRVVTVEVHTQRRTRVVVIMRFPSGATQRLRGRTGAQGWARLPYRIGRYLKRPNNHVVAVTARARVAGRLYRARATYTIG